jgi:ribosomal protein S19E (S16A)
MFASLNTVSRKTIRSASAALAFSAMLLSGCAAASVTNSTQYSTQYSTVTPANPQNVYVYTFASNPEAVKLDNSGLVHKLSTSFSGSSQAAQQTQEAVAASEALTDEVVAKLQAMGVHAIRTDAPPPADQNVLIVEGALGSIDAGNHRRRMLIGLGAGKSEVTAHVQVLYKPAGGMPQLVQTFDADANSGHMPGVAETAGVGAAVGHVATSAAIGGAAHVGAQHKGDSVTGDAKKLADSVAKQVAQIGVAQGWVPGDLVK